MMKYLIFVTFLVGVSAYIYAENLQKSKAGTKKLLQAIKEELSELKKGQGVLGEKIQSLDDRQGVLGGKIQSLDDGQGALGEKIQSLDDGQGVLGDKIQSLDDGQGVLGEKIQSLDDRQGVFGGKIQSLDDGQGVLGEKIQSLDDRQGVLGGKIQSLDDGQGVLGGKIQSLDDGQGVLGEKIQSLDDGQGVLGDKIQSLDDGQGVLGEMIQSLEKKLEKAGTWRLGMNINPADGHIFGYTVGWATGIDIGSDDEALTKDYLSAKVWVTPANYIAIVRHQRGVVDAVKVFKFKVPGESLSTRFGLKNMNPGRQIVTQGGPIQESIADDADNLRDDPIFSVGGDLAFNWAYSNNGCRIVLTGGHLSGAGVNDDNTHGLGNDFIINPLTNHVHDKAWSHDISNIQDCPHPACSYVRLQGTDHGASSNLKSGPVYGNYAIYVSFDSEKFPLPGDKLSLKIEL